ncbi:HalOD1 output domain-containing protein [Haloarcula marina]|uniref:HalOD1 output domain-containing protein n=1 Tax=Haloarcula marina TaxID=2961574 RepID=UPI003D69DAE3
MRRPSEAIVAAVAEAKDEDMTTLSPLFTRIDPDTLDRIFSATSNQTKPCNGSITFDYEGCRITVNSSGTVIVDPSELIQRKTDIERASSREHLTRSNCGKSV